MFDGSDLCDRLFLLFFELVSKVFTIQALHEMRNLQLLEHFKSRLTYQKVSASRAYTAVDPDSGDVYAALATEDAVKVLIRDQALGDQKMDDSDKFVEMCRLPAFERSDDGNVIIDFLYLPDAQAVCLCLNTGDIALISKERFHAGGEALEIVGTVDSGIQAMAWSPDQEVVVVITGNFFYGIIDTLRPELIAICYQELELFSR
jgi:elongator complex protein 1